MCAYPSQVLPIGTHEIVHTLDRLGVLELHGSTSWPELAGDEDTYPVRWREVEADSRRFQPDRANLDVEADRWARVLEDLEGRILAGTGGDDFPPPLFDLDAWYQPIHYFGRHWGIFIRESMVLDLAAHILRAIDPERRYQREVMLGALRVGLAIPFLHEMFHHKVESFAIRLEIVERVPRYCPYRKAVFDPLRAQQSDDLLEEALATAESYLRLDEPVYQNAVPADVLQRTRSFLASWIPRLPPGYRSAIDYLYEGLFDNGLNVLSSQLHEATVNPVRDSDEWRLASHIHRGLFNCKASTWVVVPLGSQPVIPWFGETTTGLAVSTKKMVRALRKLGYEELPDRGKGSHLMLQGQGLPPVTLPGGREAVSPRVLHEIARKLGFRTVAEMWAEIRA